jgi:Fatty acid desaturase
MALSLAIAIGIWWSANTVSHQFIHRPFFRRRWANVCAGRGLTILTGIPQSLWRDRHLAHHADVRFRPRLSASLLVDAALVVGLWTSLALGAPAFFAWIYAPGYALAMLLCAIHGHYEHAAGTTNHYGRVYNALCFNDGYHVEHHRYPGVHWTRLPALRDADARSSPWPAPLRWADDMCRWMLDALERIALRSRILQRALIRVHADAFASLAPDIRGARSIAIVGGGLFPRTACVLKRLSPAARITIIDASRDNLERARAFLDRDDEVRFVHARFSTAEPSAFDAVVIPLSFDGDRSAIYAHPPAPLVIVHDWIWRKRGESRIVSIALMKRVNLVRA